MILKLTCLVSVLKFRKPYRLTSKYQYYNDPSTNANCTINDVVNCVLLFCLPVPPSIQVIPNLDEVDLELKGEVNIRCRSTAGKPEPSIVWTKEVNIHIK